MASAVGKTAPIRRIGNGPNYRDTEEYKAREKKFSQARADGDQWNKIVPQLINDDELRSF